MAKLVCEACGFEREIPDKEALQMKDTPIHCGRPMRMEKKA